MHLPLEAGIEDKYGVDFWTHYRAQFVPHEGHWPVEMGDFFGL